ncbi:MAG: putative Bug-like extracytoplasmic solute binding receptor, family [Polaromonas sp.]|nr:putative Bug-like extracytoplasmic solute binding receptor, family [Polaromonas sp.]
MNFLKSLPRRALLAVAASIVLPLHAGAQAQWPSKPIKLIVPFTPGGSNDNIARVLAVKLGARLGQPVIIDNKGGAGGTIGTDFVAKAPADGYTILFASTSITTNAASGKKLPYDIVKDLEPIGMVAATPFAIVVSNELKASTLREFIALARAKPKSINYGTAGIGGTNHLATELFASAAKIQLSHVPYKGIAPAFTDLMGGNLQMLVPSLLSVAPHIRAGKMRALAVTGAQRSLLMPEIPTASEAGLPGFQLEVWFGLLGPAQLPADVVKRLNEDLNAVLAQPDMKELLAREDATPKPGTPKDLSNLIKSEVNRWTKLIKDNNIQIE